MSEHTSKSPSLTQDRDSFQSQFTYRDLRNLNRFSTHCPLRVIALIDFDAFYAQCESVRLGIPDNQPLAVQQWNAIIALNYAAKAAGLKRIINPDEARLKCPNIIIQHVPTWREGDSNWAYRSDVDQHMKTDKSALDPYRLESRKAFDLIKSVLPPSPVQKVEKASIDEVFLDLSCQVYQILLDRYPVLSKDIHDTDSANTKLPPPPTTVLGWDADKVVEAEPADREFEPPDWDDIALNIGSEIVRYVRHEILSQLKYTCSAGIARNKTIAKLAAGHNKPNKQTVVRSRAIERFYSTYKLTEIRGLGGKLGKEVVDAFDVDSIAVIREIPIETLRSKLSSDAASWVYNVIRGNEYSEVTERTQLQSMLAAKTFIPKVKDVEQAEKWLRILAGDLMNRLIEQNANISHRRPKVIAVHHYIEGRFGPTRSKQTTIPPAAKITAELLFQLSRDLLVQLSREGPTWPCLTLHVGLSHFEDLVSNTHSLTSFFTKGPVPKIDSPEKTERNVDESGCSSPLPLKRKRTLHDHWHSQAASDHKAMKTEVKSDVDDVIPLDAKDAGLTSTDDTEGYCCPKCDAMIASEVVLEHLDWHVAMELQGNDLEHD